MKLKFIIVCCILMMIIFSACSKSGNINDSANNIENIVVEISTYEAKTLVDTNQDLIIVDVRTKEEYEQGHIKGAILVPYDKIAENREDIEKFADNPILIYCRTGRRSAIAIESLREYGFPKIYHMGEGISKIYENIDDFEDVITR